MNAVAIRRLVVVESPAKAKTIKKYLGKGFEVTASYGHVRDLVPKEGAVNPEQDFAMRYQAIEKNADHVAKIAKQLERCDELYLATDPDREGEAIAWHIGELLRDNGALDDKPIHRVVFYEITKRAVKAAVEAPRDISMDLVNAQQARRALDYLVGFTLSPVLWRKVRPGLSAGRVQSAALRMIVERDAEIAQFERQEYWTIHADLIAKTNGDDTAFSAKLIEYQGEKLTQFSITTTDDANAACKTISKAAKGTLTVKDVVKKQRKRNPTPPFITSTLQQEASRKLGLSPQRTMQIAQQLYEGIDIGDGAVGLITYMRTDSVNIAQEALEELRDYIQDRYGADHLPDAPRQFKTKSKNAQEAHEAIRPTSIQRAPTEIKGALTDQQYKLYTLIWKRTLACQMIEATLETLTIDLEADNHVFRATGSTVVNPGFMKVYQEDQDDVKKDDTAQALLPPLKKGDVLPVSAIRPEQHFTEPPPRYSEASLVKALEERDIGRPSTYASILSTLKTREYVLLDNKRLKSTDIGQVVSQFLTTYFSQYVDYDFTARLEEKLDDISRGEKEWVPVLREFWFPFKERIDHTLETVKRSDVTQEQLDEECPKCGKPLTKRLGKLGRFIGCSGYPDCDYTRNIDGDDTPEEIPPEIANRSCPDCGSALTIKAGRYGKFIGCTGYPDCRFIEPLNKPEDSGVTCPECKTGTILKRRSRKGRIFYSCGRYPKCKYAIWNEPLAEPCPQCHWPILTLKTTKRRGTEKVCPQAECKYVESVPDTNDAGAS